MYEWQVTRLWRRLSQSGTALTTVDNEPVTVIYPGRANSNRGADFCDAVIATRRGVVTGDIEVHVNSADWQAHGHHHNPDYDRVVLHVVWQHTAVNIIRGNGGRRVPTVALDQYLPQRALRRRDTEEALNVGGVVCSGGSAGGDSIVSFLDRAGDDRYAHKCWQFYQAMAADEPARCLYQGLMSALGYSQNRLPFAEVARRLPIAVLAADSCHQPDDDYLIRQQALLLGTAGLLPSQRCLDLPGTDYDYISRLERQWAASRPVPTPSPIVWNLFRVRPGNLPVRRLVAMSYLLLRYRATGLTPGIVRLIRAVSADGCHTLEAGLAVAADGYWARHLNFGMSRGHVAPAMLGSNRAADMVLNVLLPFAFAWGQHRAETSLIEKCRTLYRQYPRLTANSMERHMLAQLRLDTRVVNSARRQQGLLHIYKTLCTQGKCGACPLAGNKAL